VSGCDPELAYRYSGSQCSGPDLEFPEATSTIIFDPEGLARLPQKSRIVSRREPMRGGAYIRGRRVRRAWGLSVPHTDLARHEMLDDSDAGAPGARAPGLLEKLGSGAIGRGAAIEDRAVGVSKSETGAEVATTEDASAGVAGSGSVVPPSDYGRKIVKTADIST
jgi:hypothetical protein